MRGGVLFLTNNANSLPLYKWLEAQENVVLFSDKINLEMIQYFKPDIIISYNYSYIISSRIVNFMKGKIVNLHISYLPWNRGASPNIWSFIENSIKGVTIHEIDSGLDTGKIIKQKMLDVGDDETLASSYKLLNDEITELFKTNWQSIKRNQCKKITQSGTGSFHTKADLNKFLQGRKLDYNMTIGEFKKTYCGWLDNNEKTIQ